MTGATLDMNSANDRLVDEPPPGQLRQFLLHQLPESEAMELEQRLLTNDAVLPALQLAEIDLIDDYAAGRLDEATRAAVERHLLATQQDRERLQIARALQQHRWRHRRRIAPYIGGLLLAAGLAAISLLWVPQFHARLPGATPVQVAEATYTIALLTDVSRGAAAPAEFAVPRDTSQVCLQVEVPSAGPATTADNGGLRLSVADEGGRELFASGPLPLKKKGPFEYVEARLPAAQFGTGLRHIRLVDAAGTTLNEWTLISRHG